jgi:hypothetical protein
MKQFNNSYNENISEIEYRKLEREGICNCCTRIIPKKEKKVIVFTNFKNGSYYVILCPKCISKMSNMIKEDGYETN